jgi:hypothetical protein
MGFLTTAVPIWKNRSVKLPVLLWFLLTVAAAGAELLHDTINNYYIFKGVFWHTLERSNLYVEYPSDYFDVNHYGPFFSLVIAPFAILPDWAGVLGWCLLNSFVLFFAISKLPITGFKKLIILLIAAVEMMTATHNVQMNPMLAGWLILAFVYTEKENDFWATLFIAAGFMIKIYGIAGLIFVFFSKHRLRFLVSFLFWTAIMFVLPMILSSPSFILSSYLDWADALLQKNAVNIDSSAVSYMQDISVMGFLRRGFNMSPAWNPLIIAGGFLLIVLPLMRFNQFKSATFRLLYLAIALVSIVIFSTSAESPTYVIAVSGVAIWYVSVAKSRWTNFMLWFTLIITSLSGTDLFPAYIRDNFINPYSLKALPCILVWFTLITTVGLRKFNPTNDPSWNYEARQHHIASLQ